MNAQAATNPPLNRPPPHRQPPSDAVMRHVLLDADQQWRCAWARHGFGTVVAVVSMLGMPCFYDVKLDCDDAAPRRALPCDVRRLPTLVQVAS